LVLFLTVAALTLVSSGVCLGGGPPILVQKASAGSVNDQTTVSATFTNTPGVGHLLVAIVGVKAGDTISGVSSGGNAWIEAINDPGTTSPQRPGQAIFYRTAGSIEAKTVTATTSQSTIGLQIFEYFGISFPVLIGTSHNSGPGSAPANTGVVTAFPGGVVVAGITINTPDHIDGVTNGFSERFDFVSGSAGGRQTFGSADRTGGGPPGTNNTTFSHGNNSWRAQIVSFPGD